MGFILVDMMRDGMSIGGEHEWELDFHVCKVKV
jgi:hypothetical protein